MEQQKKQPKANGPKLNDFLKFRKSDQDKSESGSESSVEVIKKKASKKPLNKSVENRKNNKNNDMFNQYTNYFFDENALNEIKNKNNKQLKETKTNAEKINKKKGLYHYQNNPKKEEKRYVDKRFETRSRNVGNGNPGVNQVNSAKEKVNTNANKKKETNNNKKTIVKQFSNHSRKRTQSNVDEENSDNDALVEKMQKVKNNNKNDKKLNNTIAYTHENNLIKDSDLNRSKRKLNNKNVVIKKHNSKHNKNNNKKPNHLVQNLIDDFDQTMEEYSNLYCNTTTRGNNKNSIDKKMNNRSASKRKLKNALNNKHSKKNFNNSNENKLVNHSVMLYQDPNILQQNIPKKNGISLTSNLKKVNSKIHKENSKKKKNKDDSDSELNNRKRSKASSKYNLREDELPLYKGEIDYNNVSIKNISESIDDLFARYKKKGFTCVKKGDTEFKFIRGPNTHIVEIMRLGNGLLYFNVTK